MDSTQHAWGVNKAPGSAQGNRKFRMQLTKTCLLSLLWNVPSSQGRKKHLPSLCPAQESNQNFLGHTQALPPGCEGSSCVLWVRGEAEEPEFVH